MEEKVVNKNVLIVGAGGIGTTLVDLLVPALERTAIDAKITLLDGDIVEASNLGHQRFTEEQIGQHKVTALAGRFAGKGAHVELIAKNENLRNAEQLIGYDLVVVCVDRPEPRRLVHALDVPWIDLRCSGDGWMILSSDSDAANWSACECFRTLAHCSAVEPCIMPAGPSAVGVAACLAAA